MIISPDDRQFFETEGYLLIKNFYDHDAEIMPIQRDIYEIIGLVAQRHDIKISRRDFSPESFDEDYYALLAHDRRYASEVYDLTKQIPSFLRLISNQRSETLFRELRNTELAKFWSTARQRIVEQERGLAPDDRIAIYGAGIYGNFIRSCLANPDRVTCFLDQNRFLQGKELNGVPIVHPDNLPDDAGAVFVGLNPLNARRIIASVESLQSRKVPCFFLN
ncbi:hypothetical protein [Hoeflea sp.]|uniref:hypothetical protein n=1 Tax=Hoeflea sp. TaxID=1940281 RepID=UPI002AFE5092|nr:hypothetical protein [Hoeflea sp.]